MVPFQNKDAILPVQEPNFHHDVIKWKHFPRNWPFVRGIHLSPVNSPHKGQWRGALMFSLICAWISSWVNNREAGDLRRHRVHYYVIVMCIIFSQLLPAPVRRSLGGHPCLLCLSKIIILMDSCKIAVIDERLCNMCNCVDDELHYITACAVNVNDRRIFYDKLIHKFSEFQHLYDLERFVFLFIFDDAQMLSWLGKLLYISFRSKSTQMECVQDMT